MSSRDLIERLNAALGGSDFAVREGEAGCMLVERRGYLRGIWHCDGARYAWIPGGYSEPAAVFDSEEAVIGFMVSQAR